MASQQQTIKLTAASFHPGGNAIHNDFASPEASRPLSQHDPHITPYLGLRARLSQTWINRWTILLLLVLIRTLLAIGSLDDNLASARRQALSACTSVEQVGSTMASMPHYMSRGVNEMTADGIDKAINGLMKMLVMSITVVEELVLFVINMLTSTYVCLVTLVISGSLHVAVKVAEDVGNFLNSTVQTVGKDLGNMAADFQGAMDGFLRGVNNVGDFFTGKDTSPPTIDLTSQIQKLNSLTLPSGYDEGLEKLNASIPNYDQVRNMTDTAIRFPFEQVKKLLNESLPNYAMDRSLFNVPPKEQLTFCSDSNGINDFFDNLVNIEQVARKTFIAVLLIAALAVMVPMAYREVRGYRIMRDRANLISTDSRDSMDSVYLVSRPYTSSAGLWLSEKVASHKHKILVRWTVAYATTVPALFVLSLAVAGLLACLCQFILLKAIEKEVPELQSQIIDFTNQVAYKLNNASEQWAIGTNKMISDTNTTINNDVFGWVQTSTTAINDTLNVFVDEMTHALNATFGGTILYDPIREIFHCLIGLKVESIEKGLTWVHDHAHIDFPLMANDTFSLGTLDQANSSKAELMASDDDSGAGNQILNAVYHVTESLTKGVRQEAIISFCVLLIWFLIVFIGIGQAIYLSFHNHDAILSTRSTTPNSSGSSSSSPFKHTEKAFDPVQIPPAPTYNSLPVPSHTNDNNTNKYKGQSYTLNPAPLPQFSSDPNPPAQPRTNNFLSKLETLKQVGGHHVVDAAICRATHARTSSHGDLGVTSPVGPPQSSSSGATTATKKFVLGAIANSLPKNPRIDRLADPFR